jgi:hypothetical protein
MTVRQLIDQLNNAADTFDQEVRATTAEDLEPNIEVGSVDTDEQTGCVLLVLR